MDVSVIVPFRNPGAHFRSLLESLVSQELEAGAEIIAVDNGSTDGSPRVAQQVSGRIPVKVVEAREHANASYARNVGVAAAAGSKLLFVDADDEVAPGYLAAMVRALDSHDFVTSRVDSETLNAPWLRDAHGPPWQAEGVITFFGFLPATGVNVGLRRTLFDRVGGFPEEFTGSQDIVFSWRVQQAGAAIHFVPDALYRYRYRDSLRGLFRQTRNWGRSNVLLYRNFRAAGMPGRTVKMAAREWISVIADLCRTRNRAQLAPVIVRLGYCVGRLSGSLSHRVLYP